MEGNGWGGYDWEGKGIPFRMALNNKFDFTF